MLPCLPARQLALLAALFALPVQTRQSAPPHRPRQVGPPSDDCNLNGIHDAIDIAHGTSPDCNANQVPDECDVGTLTLIAESFEAGLPEGWSTSGLAHVTDQCARPSECDGSSFVYFGIDEVCDFNDGLNPGGSLSLPDVDIPASASSVTLTFCSAYQGEGAEPYDAADVYVNGAILDHVSPLPQLDWETRTIDLSHLIGETADIDFIFNAMDNIGNEFLGWQVDNVRLTAFGVGEPALDCDANGVPDECDPDCNANGLPDACDIASGAAEDCNLNGIPDACDLASLASTDCNLNAIPDECDLALDLPATIANLEAGFSAITAHFPDTQDFPEDNDGICIDFDFLGTFDCASTLNTNRGTELPYTGGVARPEPGFGPQGLYFTAKHFGLFTMVATGCSIDTFAIGGNNGGATGNGTVDGLELSIHVDGQPYSIYVKRMYGQTNVSVNQVIAIPGDGTGVTHSFPGDPTLSEQTLEGLAGTDRIYYMLVCRRIPGEPAPALRPIDAQEIVRELIGLTVGPLSSDANGDGVPDECD